MLSRWLWQLFHIVYAYQNIKSYTLNIYLRSSKTKKRLCVCVSCLVVSNSLQPHRPQPHQAPLSMGFSRQEHWSRLPFPSPKGTIERKKVKSFSHVWLFVTPWTAACQSSLSNNNSWSLLKLMPIKSVMPFNHLILCHLPLLLPSIFPSIRVFFNESTLHIRKIVQGLFPLGLTGLISLLSEGLSRVFSNPTVQKHQFFGAQLSLRSNSYIHTWLLEKP